MKKGILEDHQDKLSNTQQPYEVLIVSREVDTDGNPINVDVAMTTESLGDACREAIRLDDPDDEARYMRVMKYGTQVTIDFREYRNIGAIAVALSNAAKHVDYLEGYLSDRWEAIEAADPQTTQALENVLGDMHVIIYKLLLSMEHRTSQTQTKENQNHAGIWHVTRSTCKKR